MTNKLRTNAKIRPYCFLRVDVHAPLHASCFSTSTNGQRKISAAIPTEIARPLRQSGTLHLRNVRSTNRAATNESRQDLRTRFNNSKNAKPKPERSSDRSVTIRTKIGVRKISLVFDLLLGNCALSEPVLESSGHGLHVSHPPRPLGAAALGLLAPVVLTHLLRGVPARAADALLDVVGHLAAPTARCVGLGVPLTEGRCSFRLC